MKRIFLVFITVALTMASIGCCLLLKQTVPKDSEERTRDLLDIHFEIAPVIEFDINKNININNAKIIMLSDLHRGMGKNDAFQNNRELFQKILGYYYDNGYTLVLIGDCEEGWGFQRDNIPTILKAHKDEFDIEKEFIKSHRYYRLYGNHDDFFRGQLLYSEELGLHSIYPAIIFKLKIPDEDNDFTILVTHGSQGHGLHDAGDELASWGVFTKYTMLMDFLPKEGIKSSKHLEKMLQSYKQKLASHEEMVYNWAFEGGEGVKKCNILVAGHTHVPAFNSHRNPCLFKLILEDLEDKKKELKEKKKKNGRKTARDDEETTEPTDHFEEEQIDYVEEILEEFEEDEDVQISDKVDDPFYFNTGCGFHRKITCIEIKEGKIYLKFLGFENGKNRNINFDDYLEVAKLKDYKKTHCEKLDSAIINAFSFCFKNRKNAKVELISASEKSTKGPYCCEVTVLVTPKNLHLKSEVHIYLIREGQKDNDTRVEELPEGVRIIDEENRDKLIGCYNARSKLEKPLQKIKSRVSLSWPLSPTSTEPLYYFDFDVGKKKVRHAVGAHTGKVYY